MKFLITIFRAFSIIMGAFSFHGCVQDVYPKEVIESLKQARDNKKNLVAVLEHYRVHPSDSLKFKAACFLIANMREHKSLFAISDTKGIHLRSFQYLDSLTKAEYFSSDDSLNFQFADFMHNFLDNQDFVPTAAYLDSAVKYKYLVVDPEIALHRLRTHIFEDKCDSTAKVILQTIVQEKNQKSVSDLERIKYDWLVNHIDNAFVVWRNSTFARSLTFEEFTQTILSYRSSNEALDLNSKEIRKIFDTILNSKSIEIVVKRLNFYMYCLDILEDNGRYLGNLGFYDILQLYKYDCDRHSEWAVRVLNACGIPAALDFTSGYFNRDKLHFGVSVRDTSGRFRHFSPKWQGLGDLNHAKMFSKVFRRTFESQESPSTLRLRDEQVPLIFEDSFIKDVTDEYHKVQDITLPYRLLPKNINVGYIAIFTHRGWRPIGWGKISQASKTMTFQKIPLRASYIVGFYKEGILHPTSFPFFLDSKGNVLPLRSDTKERITLNLKRKYPEKEKLIELMKKMIGAQIQGANKLDFSDPVLLHVLELKDFSGFTLKSINIVSKAAVRYVRCVASSGETLNIATLEFYSSRKLNWPTSDFRHAGRPDSLFILRLTGSPLKSDQNVALAFDSDNETFVNAHSIGLDLRKRHQITQVKVAARNSNNGIVIGDKYQLLYYDESWKIVGTQKATDNFLQFTGVPANALYWLRNLDHGSEELSFIYRNGRQIFLNSETDDYF